MTSPEAAITKQTTPLHKPNIAKKAWKNRSPYLKLNNLALYKI